MLATECCCVAHPAIAAASVSIDARRSFIRLVVLAGRECCHGEHRRKQRFKIRSRPRFRYNAVETGDCIRVELDKAKTKPLAVMHRVADTETNPNDRTNPALGICHLTKQTHYGTTDRACSKT